MVNPIPAGYHSVTPYLIVREAARAIAFSREAFGAQEVMRFDDPGGRIAHAEIRIGDSHVMLADETGEFAGPQTLGGAGVSLLLYVEDVDAVVERARAAGATVLMPVQDQFYGDRSGKLADPFGHHWHVSTHKEDLTPDEVDRRSKAFLAQHPECA
jgi:PhnB protein